MTNQLKMFIVFKITAIHYKQFTETLYKNLNSFNILNLHSVRAPKLRAQGDCPLCPDLPLALIPREPFSIPQNVKRLVPIVFRVWL